MSHGNADLEFPFCDDVAKYEKLAKIGQGTFGEVFKARDKTTRKLVALKKILMDNEKEGFPITALREIRILQLLKNENVVNLIEICRTKSSDTKGKATFYLVFEFCEHDLAGLLSNLNVKFSLGEIKSVMKQLLNGLYFIHSNKILHRDMKAANILITKTGCLKLADFGLARAYSQQNKANRYTNRVVTLWYRPPELLLGERNYGPPVDLWGAGCIMAELWTRSPLMQGSSEQNQLLLISQLCGSICPEVWPGVERLELFRSMELPKGLKRRLKDRLRTHVKDSHALELVDRLLTLDPSKRSDADTLLNHDFFWSDPMPADIGKMLSHHTQSMFEFNARRRNGQVVPNAPRIPNAMRAQGPSDEQEGHNVVMVPEVVPRMSQDGAELEFPFCDDVAKYEKLTKIGQGTFGEVFKARDKTTKKIVALKKVLMDNEKEGFPITALREIKILQLLKHENVVNLIEICRTKSSDMKGKATFYLVFDFCEHDLAGLLSNMNVKFSLGEIKKVMKQLLNGLYFIHSNKILHRDMKAANILITKTGCLKLADFGLARAYSQQNKANRYTNRVVTLWYRPPELLLGERNYGAPVDLWGAGCIMAEMWTRSPIMQGGTEQHQLMLISQLCGSICPEVWPGVEKLELYSKLDLPKGLKRKVKERLKAYVKDNNALELLDKLLTLDPSKRSDADNLLNHDFFWSDPMPADLGKMLSQHSQSMFEFLAPRRRLNNGPAGANAPHIPNPPRASHGTSDGQYHDRVF
ncbi:hypothetical protein B4U80_06221, partial [Leptotrombidium deliense]